MPRGCVCDDRSVGQWQGLPQLSPNDQGGKEPLQDIFIILGRKGGRKESWPKSKLNLQLGLITKPQLLGAGALTCCSAQGYSGLAWQGDKKCPSGFPLLLLLQTPAPNPKHPLTHPSLDPR